MGNRTPKDKWIPAVAVAAPVICYGLESFLKAQWGFSFGFALLPVNGLLTFLGLWALPQSMNDVNHSTAHL
jgi:hypothetical protein